ncbi:hypothetical protein HMH01_13270 [Halovulum dunhuangense]|uniref:Uncharacterized protein n=1 Tax=Halovulum dunhuangense TaxID=1505036 RepID=A0A849L5L0_9RHOB|nr:hypothetical protein [Halovulum dunhuangense]NNU81407.1 hypothetical protein [Halovulum dunhuangense]
MEHVVTAMPVVSAQRGSWLKRLLAAVIAQDEEFRQGRAFNALDDHLRQDVGLLPHANLRPASWDAPLPMTLR